MSRPLLIPDVLSPVASRIRVDPSGCLIWTGSIMPNGYGQLELRDESGKRKHWLAHRYTWTLANPGEPLPPNLHHVCHTRPCVHPSHLRGLDPGEHTRLHNLRDGCHQGHEWTPANTYIRPDNGARMCRACMNARSRALYSRESARLIQARTERRRRARARLDSGDDDG